MFDGKISYLAEFNKDTNLDKFLLTCLMLQTISIRYKGVEMCN